MLQNNSIEITFSQLIVGLRVHISHTQERTLLSSVYLEDNDLVSLQTLIDLVQEKILYLGTIKLIKQLDDLNKDEIEYRIDVIVDNIQKFIEPEVSSNMYQHKENEENKGKVDETTYAISESVLFALIFEYLPYEDLLSGVYKIEGMLHRISLKAMNATYLEFAYCKLFTHNNRVFADICKQIHPYLRLRKDIVLILNALAMNMVDRIVEQCNVYHEELNKQMSSNESLRALMDKILRKAKVEGELRIQAVNKFIKELRQI